VPVDAFTPSSATALPGPEWLVAQRAAAAERYAAADLPDPSAHGLPQGPGLFADGMLPADDARRGAS